MTGQGLCIDRSYLILNTSYSDRNKGETMRAAGQIQQSVDSSVYSAINNLVEILNLLLCMYVGMLLLQNPLFGAALYVSALFLTSFIKLFQRRKQLEFSAANIIIWCVMCGIAIGLDCVLVMLYPSLVGNRLSEYCILFVMIIVCRSIALEFVYHKMAGRAGRQIVAELIQIVLMVPIILLCERYTTGFHSALIYITYLVTGFITLLQLNRGFSNLQLTYKKSDNLTGISSYKLYRGMTLYSYIALYLSLILYFCYMFCFNYSLEVNAFIVTAGWTFLVIGVSMAAYRLIVKTGRVFRIGLFIFGACLWIFSSIMLYNAKNAILGAWWSTLWGVGLALMYAVLSRMDKSFKLFSILIDREITDVTLQRNAMVVQNFALLIAGIISLAVLTGWSLALPHLQPGMERYFNSGAILLPMLFMIPSIILALRQPMDERNEGRLKKLERGAAGEEMRLRLRTILVGKYRKRLGVRFLMAIIRPFMRHKVMGREHVDAESFPAIFVCNHGEIYGPVAAVLYLPYYFRPWIDERMLNSKKSAAHIYQGTFARVRLLPEKIKWLLAKVAGGLSRWAFGNFDPIPVFRDDLRSILKTFKLTVAAMEADENILIFPENPLKTEDQKYAEGEVGAFFTGFAHVGKAYYAQTGKSATFYPVFADKKKRIFEIGEGVRYRPDNSPGEEKRRIADYLYQAMQEMAKHE